LFVYINVPYIGIDANVCMVLHVGTDLSMLSFMQKSGRAGRVERTSGFSLLLIDENEESEIEEMFTREMVKAPMAQRNPMTKFKISDRKAMLSFRDEDSKCLRVLNAKYLDGNESFTPPCIGTAALCGVCLNRLSEDRLKRYLSSIASFDKAMLELLIGATTVISTRDLPRASGVTLRNDLDLDTNVVASPFASVKAVDVPYDSTVPPVPRMDVSNPFASVKAVDVTSYTGSGGGGGGSQKDEKLDVASTRSVSIESGSSFAPASPPCSLPAESSPIVESSFIVESSHACNDVTNRVRLRESSGETPKKRKSMKLSCSVKLQSPILLSAGVVERAMIEENRRNKQHMDMLKLKSLLEQMHVACPMCVLSTGSFNRLHVENMNGFVTKCNISRKQLRSNFASICFRCGGSGHGALSCPFDLIIKGGGFRDRSLSGVCYRCLQPAMIGGVRFHELNGFGSRCNYRNCDIQLFVWYGLTHYKELRVAMLKKFKFPRSLPCEEFREWCTRRCKESGILNVTRLFFSMLELVIASHGAGNVVLTV
jgi:hypothetical protein